MKSFPNARGEREFFEFAAVSKGAVWFDRRAPFQRRAILALTSLSLTEELYRAASATLPEACLLHLVLLRWMRGGTPSSPAS